MHAIPYQQLFYLLDEIRVLQMGAGHIYRHGDNDAVSRLPPAQITAYLLVNHEIQLFHISRALQKRHKLRWACYSAVRFFPAGQSLRPRYTPRTQVYLGLQIKSELLPFQRRLQVRLQTDGARHLVFECFIKHSAGSAILLFCLLVRDIRTVNGRRKPLSAAL